MTGAELYALLLVLVFFLGLLLYFWILKLISSACHFLDAKTRELEKHD